MSILKGSLAAVCFIAMIANPALVAESTLFALNTWWNAVVPALLPFFIAAELMQGFGIMSCLSLWLEPIMRPIFRLPGGAALAVVMGFTAGSPTGAGITANLRAAKLCTKEEGERLLAFTNNVGPLYILVAVSVGILQRPELGLLLFLSHHPLNLLFGILLGRLGKRQAAAERLSIRHALWGGLQAIRCCHSEPLGKVFAASIRKALVNIGTVGGYIVIFSLLSAILAELHITDLLALLLRPLCHLYQLDPATAPALAKGVLEMTIGVAELPACEISLHDRTVAAAIILAWNGLSVHAQVAGMVNHTDLTIRKYLLTRVLHTLTAPALVLLLGKKIAPAFAGSGLAGANMFIFNWGALGWLCADLLLLGILAAVGLLLLALRRQRVT